MHQLFCGTSVEPLSHSPFEPSEAGGREFAAADLGWTLAGAPCVRFLPCLALFEPPERRGAYPEVLEKTRHVPLNEDPQFMEIFVDELGFPGAVDA